MKQLYLVFLTIFLVSILFACKNNSEQDYSISQETKDIMAKPSTKIFIDAYSWAISANLLPSDSDLLRNFLKMSQDSISEEKRMEYAQIFKRLVNDNLYKSSKEQLNLIEYQNYYEKVINKDSSQYFFSLGKENFENKNYYKAIKYFENCLKYYPINYEARLFKARATKEVGRFDSSIMMLYSIIRDTLIKDINKETLKIEIANSYKLLGDKLLLAGQKESAIINYSIAADKGNKEARRKYEKLNPVIRKIMGYRTKCCDGTYSDARNEGACSHHKGVCDWNEPIYENHRRIE